MVRWKGRVFSCPGSQVPGVLPPIEESGREHRRSTTKLLPGTTPNRCALISSHGSSGSALSAFMVQMGKPGRQQGDLSKSVAGLPLCEAWAESKVPKVPQRAVSGDWPQCCGLSGSPGSGPHVFHMESRPPQSGLAVCQGDPAHQPLSRRQGRRGLRPFWKMRVCGPEEKET